jgi:hypothetical protein
MRSPSAEKTRPTAPLFLPVARVAPERGCSANWRYKRGELARETQTTGLFIAASGGCPQVSPRIDGLLDVLLVPQRGFVGLVRRFFIDLFARLLGILPLGFGEWLSVAGVCKAAMRSKERRPSSPESEVGR